MRAAEPSLQTEAVKLFGSFFISLNNSLGHPPATDVMVVVVADIKKEHRLGLALKNLQKRGRFFLSFV